MIGRRGFIAGILGACAAPAIVRASSLMPIKAPEIVTLGMDLGSGDSTTLAVVRGEIGRIESFRFIEAEVDLQRAVRAGAPIEVIRRAIARLKRQYTPPPVVDGRYELMGFAHAEQYADLRGPVLRK